MSAHCGAVKRVDAGNDGECIASHANLSKRCDLVERMVGRITDRCRY